MISETFNLRKQYGKFQEIPAENCPSHEHVDHCEACGSRKPEKLIAVSAKGWVGMVGSTCARILCNSKNPKVDEVLKGTGEIYQDGEKTIVYVTGEWLRELGDYNHVSANQMVTRYSPGAGYTQMISNYENNYWGSAFKNDFLQSIYTQAREYGKISIKQYQKANEVMGK